MTHGEVSKELREALQQALECMKADWHHIDGEWGPIGSWFGDLEGAISAKHPTTEAIRVAREALARTAEQRDAAGTPNQIPYGWTHSRTYWVEVGPHAQEIMEASAKELGEGCEAFPLYAVPVNSEGA